MWNMVEYIHIIITLKLIKYKMSPITIQAISYPKWKQLLVFRNGHKVKLFNHVLANRVQKPGYQIKYILPKTSA